MTPTPEQCAGYATKLTNAETALDKLITGGKVEVLRDGANSIQYTRADIAQLRAYIAMLQGKVDACNGCNRNKRRILHVIPLG